jgi:hypothetical protein
MGLLSKLLRRSQSAGKVSLFAAMLCCGIAFISCTNDPAPPSQPDPGTNGSLSYTMYAHNLRDVRPGESLHLWALYEGDVEWTWMVKLKMPSLYGDDSSRLAGRYKFTREIDNIEKLMISVESVDSPSAPTAKLIAGAFNFNTATLRAEDAEGVGDYSSIDASVIFASQSADTTRYLKEFYFARRVDGKLEPSIDTLPTPPDGWKYAIWFSDSNYYPEHKFFYGFLTSPDLPDTRSSKDTYPLPGGFEGPQLDRLGGRLYVTLEPPTLQTSLGQVGPSPFSILAAELPKKLVRDQTLEMINVENTGLPVVKFSVKREQ